jgi:hypothetical protein
VPAKRRRRRGISLLGLLAVLAAAVGLYLAFQQVAPMLRSSGCNAKADGRLIPLSPSQAGIAATIAGVADHRRMPTRAVTIAYAAAMQESKLQNLRYGLQDSVGVFQQRPSEGWGTARQIEDPVYAATRFFEALSQVPGYTSLPVYQAAQDVQRSADGYAYRQYQYVAARMARAFAGRVPHAVWCWYPGLRTSAARLAAATRELVRTFGPLSVRRGSDPDLTIRARGAQGWAVAAWLVANAQDYGVTSVRYDDFAWTAGGGGRGWTRSHGIPAGVVIAG